MRQTEQERWSDNIKVEEKSYDYFTVQLHLQFPVPCIILYLVKVLGRVDLERDIVLQISIITIIILIWLYALDPDPHLFISHL